MLIRLKTGWSGPLHPQADGVAIVTPSEGNALIASGDAEPVCGSARDVQIAAMLSAAAVLGATITTGDRDIQQEAAVYGATVNHPRSRG